MADHPKLSIKPDSPVVLKFTGDLEGKQIKPSQWKGKTLPGAQHYYVIYLKGEVGGDQTPDKGDEFSWFASIEAEKAVVLHKPLDGDTPYTIENQTDLKRWAVTNPITGDVAYSNGFELERPDRAATSDETLSQPAPQKPTGPQAQAPDEDEIGPEQALAQAQVKKQPEKAPQAEREDRPKPWTQIELGTLDRLLGTLALRNLIEIRDALFQGDGEPPSLPIELVKEKTCALMIMAEKLRVRATAKQIQEYKDWLQGENPGLTFTAPEE